MNTDFSLPENERTAVNAELKSVCDRIALLVAVAQGANEQPRIRWSRNGLRCPQRAAG
jgi:hypothetical protein